MSVNFDKPEVVKPKVYTKPEVVASSNDNYDYMTGNTCYSNNKYAAKASKEKKLPSFEIDWKIVGIVAGVIAGIALLVGLVFGVVKLVKTYSYTTVEVSRGETYSRTYNIERDYKAPYTEIYYTTDSEGNRHRRTRYHEAEYYFYYNGYRHRVNHSLFNTSYTTASITYQMVTYRHIPNFPDYPNKINVSPFTKEEQVSEVVYR